MGRSHHDRLFKAAFRDPRNLAVLLRDNLPGAVLDLLDLANAEEVPGTFVDPTLTERISDLLFRVPFAGNASYVYVLAEHQSTPDSLMGLRLLIYMGRIWDRWLREAEQTAKTGGSKVPKRIPAILPLVIFQGPGGWSATGDFHDLIDLPPEQLAAVRHHIPSFRYAIENLAQLSDGEIRDRPLSPLGTMGLVLLKHARDKRESFAHAIEDFVDVFWTLSPDDKKMGGVLI